jgi:hypothetical protein
MPVIRRSAIDFGRCGKSGGVPPSLARGRRLPTKFGRCPRGSTFAVGRCFSPTVLERGQRRFVFGRTAFERRSLRFRLRLAPLRVRFRRGLRCRRRSAAVEKSSASAGKGWRLPPPPGDGNRRGRRCREKFGLSRVRAAPGWRCRAIVAVRVHEVGERMWISLEGWGTSLEERGYLWRDGSASDPDRGCRGAERRGGRAPRGRCCNFL